MVAVSQSLYKHHFSFAPTLRGAQDKVPSEAAVKTDESWMLRSGCCSPVGHEPSSISIKSLIWQTHQRQETTPLPVSIQPWPRVQGAGQHLQTNVPQDRAYLPRGSRGQRVLQPQTRDNTLINGAINKQLHHHKKAKVCIFFKKTNTICSITCI